MTRAAMSRDLFGLLATELVDQIMDSLCRTDVLAFSRVSRRTRALAIRHKNYALSWVVNVSSLRRVARINQSLARLADLFALGLAIALVFDIKSQTHTEANFIPNQSVWSKSFLPRLNDLLGDHVGGHVVVLEIRVPQCIADPLFQVFTRPMPHLRQLIVESRQNSYLDWDYYEILEPDHYTAIPQNLFAGHAPCLRAVFLDRAVLPTCIIPAFSCVSTVDKYGLNTTEVQNVFACFPALRMLAFEPILSESTSVSTSSTALQLSSVVLRRLCGCDRKKALEFCRMLRNTIVTSAAVNIKIRVEPDYDCCGDMEITFACAATLLPAHGAVSIRCLAQQCEPDDLMCTCQIVWQDPTGRTITVELHSCFGEDLSDVFFAFYDHLYPSTRVTEFETEFRCLRMMELMHPRAARELGRLTLKLRSDEVEQGDIHPIDWLYDDDSQSHCQTVGSWMRSQQLDRADSEYDAGHIVRHTIPASAQAPLALLLVTNPDNANNLDIHPLFVDMLMQHLGFSTEGRRAQIVLGRGLTMTQKMLQWDAQARQLNIVNSWYST